MADLSAIDYHDPVVYDITPGSMQINNIDYRSFSFYDLTPGQVQVRLNNIELITTAVQGPPPTPTPPVISNKVPTPGSNIYSTTQVSCDVTEDSGVFLELMIYVVYNGIIVDGRPKREIVYMDGTFSSEYVTNSAVNGITNGLHFDMVRTGGWLASPSFFVKAIDATGAENP